MAEKDTSNRMNTLVAEARKAAEEREQGYRAKALKMYPWVCGRCEREFTRANLQELTVHHRNHDHDYNPEDGSNWELLCVYCHDNEHSRYTDATGFKESATGIGSNSTSHHNPFAGLKGMIQDKEDE